MKLRDSGMPAEAYWEMLFDVPLILDRLGIDAQLADVAELGCGYGTFTVPIAQRIAGTLTTCDIEGTRGQHNAHARPASPISTANNATR